MERDFMGLAVKQEVTDENTDSAPVRSSGMQWSFSKGGSPPQLFSFRGTKDDKPKTGFDSLASTGLVTITTSETFDADRNPYSGDMKKNSVQEKLGGIQYSVTTYPAQNFDGHPVHRPQETRPTGSISQHPFSAATSTVPVVPSSSPVVGTTDLRNAPKTVPAPSQLTIFYAGSVCVYDDVSPEKAQAIMLLAGNGPPAPPTTTPAPAPAPVPVPAPAPVHIPVSRPSVHEGLVANQLFSTLPHGSSPFSAMSISVSHSAGGPARNNEIKAAKPSGVLMSPSNKDDVLRGVNPIRSIPPAFLSSSTVPQFRQKSLARFLEKRRERVISASPYPEKSSPDCVILGSSGSTSFSTNSSGPCPVPATR